MPADLKNVLGRKKTAKMKALYGCHYPAVALRQTSINNHLFSDTVELLYQVTGYKGHVLKVLCINQIETSTFPLGLPWEFDKRMYGGRSVTSLVSEREIDIL